MSADTYDERLAVLEARLSQLDAAAEPRAAPLGFFQVAPGESILSDHMNTAVLQGVPPFASAAARTAAIPSPAAGSITRLTDTDTIDQYRSGQWRSLTRPDQGSVSFSTGSAAGGHSRITAVAGNNVIGGITYDGAGRLTLTRSGLYLINGIFTTTSASVAWYRAYVKDDAGTVTIKGSHLAGTGVGGSSLVVGQVRIMTVPISLGLWVELSAAANWGDATNLVITRVGDTT